MACTNLDAKLIYFNNYLLFVSFVFLLEIIYLGYYG
jgi:hypothetical protein